MLLKLLKNLTGRPDLGNRGNGESLGGQLASSENRAQQEFSYALLAEFFKLLHVKTENNYDHARYGYDGSDLSQVFNVGGHVDYLHTYFDHAEEFFSSCMLFQDAASRELFRRLVLYRMLGHLHVSIKDGVTWETQAALLSKAREFDVGPSSLDVGGTFGPIRHHEGIPTPEGLAINLDCWNGNIAATVLKKQYYFSRGGVVIAPEVGDIILDAGACFGDTAVYFARTVGANGHIYAFDPLPSHNRVIDFNIKQNGLDDRITPARYAVGEATFTPVIGESRQTLADSAALPGFTLLGGNPGFPVTTLDEYVEKNAISRVNFIKMDIEGFELPALKGARHVIEHFRPKLAISLYHKPLDMIDIPLWIERYFPDYELYLDHYTIHHEETVLYARARDD